MPTAIANLLANGQIMPLGDVPLLAFDEFKDELCDLVQAGGLLSALFGRPVEGNRIRLTAVVSHAEASRLALISADVGDKYPSITRDCPQAHWFEREIAEQWGVVPEGHPWLKPIRFHPSYRPGHDAWGRTVGEQILPCVTNYFRVEGEEVHEVAVGPVHAGVIEPGHFRFQCHGEHVFTLEIELGYQHRGVERHLIGGPDKRTIHYMETLAGDTSIGHTTAYCELIEGFSGTQVPLRAQAIRGIALELERLANHVGDLGALAGDVGFLPTLNYCGRLRGDFLNATALICGNRFGRSLVQPGGVRFDIDGERPKQLAERLKPALRDVGGACHLMWDSQTVQARFEECGKISQTMATDLGLVGPAARACGDDRDVRHDFPTGIFRFSHIPVSSSHTGDVFARAFVRWLEVQRSGDFILSQLKSLPAGDLKRPLEKLHPDAIGVSLVEGWRGQICHVAITDAAGKFSHYKIVDPSFHNWIGLAMALRNQQISDFPLNNKSFNLSYCGHDL